MKQKYTIPGYFKDCLVKNNRIVEDGFFGKTLYEYSNHKLKEFKFFGSTVLIFKKRGIYKPGFLTNAFSMLMNAEELRKKAFSDLLLA